MHILLFFLIIIIIIVVLGLSIVGAVLRTIFGIGRRSSRSKQTGYGHSNPHQYQSGNSQGSDNSSNSKEENIYSEESQRNKHKKIFTKEDGEYVDFEEIK